MKKVTSYIDPLLPLLGAALVDHAVTRAIDIYGATGHLNMELVLIAAIGVWPTLFFQFWKTYQKRRETQQLEAVKVIATRVGRGVYKRIDENRELLELLRDSAPDLLKSAPWIEGWLASHDDFFTEIAKAVGVENAAGRSSTKPYPRAWPIGSSDAHGQES